MTGRILVLTYPETDPRTGRKRLMVDHGIDTRTDRVVVMPQVPLTELPGARFDQDAGEWFLEDSPPRRRAA